MGALSQIALTDDLTACGDVATRCRLAQNCLSAVQSAAPPDWHALTVLINNDVPKILDKVTQLLQGARD
jgi:hypothetical protein